MEGVKRIGIRTEGKARPLLVTVSTTDERNFIVEKARGTTNLGAGVRVKKDSHPAVRAEWKRLFDLKTAEEQKEVNIGKVVPLDHRKRQVTVDGRVIDPWKPFFLESRNNSFQDFSTITIFSWNI